MYELLTEEQANQNTIEMWKKIAVENISKGQYWDHEVAEGRVSPDAIPLLQCWLCQYYRTSNGSYSGPACDGCPLCPQGGIGECETSGPYAKWLDHASSPEARRSAAIDIVLACTKKLATLKPTPKEVAMPKPKLLEAKINGVYRWGSYILLLTQHDADSFSLVHLDNITGYFSATNGVPREHIQDLIDKSYDPENFKYLGQLPDYLASLKKQAVEEYILQPASLTMQGFNGEQVRLSVNKGIDHGHLVLQVNDKTLGYFHIGANRAGFNPEKGIIYRVD